MVFLEEGCDRLQGLPADYVLLFGVACFDVDGHAEQAIGPLVLQLSFYVVQSLAIGLALAVETLYLGFCQFFPALFS